MRYSVISLQLILLFVFWDCASAQISPKPPVSDSLIRQQVDKAVAERTKALETDYAGRLKNLDENYRLKLKNLEDSYKNKTDHLNRTIETLSAQLDARVKKTETLTDMIIPVGIFGVILIIWRIFAGVPKQIEIIAREKFEKRFDKEVEDLFERKENVIKRLVKDQDEETILKKSKFILVLHHPDSNLEFIRGFFDRDFPNVRYAPFNENEDCSRYDIVFFHNEDEKLFSETGGVLDLNRIQTFAREKLKNTCVFFNFGRPLLKFEKDVLQKTASTTFRSQLHGNIANALRFQNHLEGQ